MTVKLYVNWRERKILTNQQLEEQIDERVEHMMSDDACYEEYLEDYLDCNYTKIELFEALTKGEAFIRETIDDIKSGVAEGIVDWCECDIRGDYEEVKIEV